MGLQFHTKITNGSIDLPETIRRSLGGDTDVLVTIEKDISHEKSDLFESLFRSPLKTNSIKPLTREEAHERKQ